MRTWMLVLAVAAGLLLGRVALADEAGKKPAEKEEQKGDPKGDPKADPKDAKKPGDKKPEAKPEAKKDGLPEPGLVAGLLGKIMVGFSDLLKEKDALKRVEIVEKMLDGLFDAIVRLSVRKQDAADLKVILEAYTHVIKGIGPAQFKTAADFVQRTELKANRERAGEIIRRFYGKLTEYMVWMIKYYNTECPAELKPTLKTAIMETQMLIRRFIAWYAAIPGLKAPLLDGPAARAQEAVDKALQGNQGASDALRQAWDAMRFR